MVTTVEDAMADGAPLLHPEFANNVASHSRLEIGDIDDGFEEADLVIEREFRTKTVHQGYIEPHSATAWWTPQDRITVWGSSQGHFQIRDLTAAVVGVPFSSVKVVPMEIGGGFGGKTTIYLEPVAVALSKKSGQPVKITMNRIEVMEATGPTSGSYMNVKIGVTNDGKMTAAYADLRFEAGAYPGSPVGAAANCIFSPYDIPNILIDAYDVVDNKPKTTAYRAPGAPIGSFAAESDHRRDLREARHGPDRLPHSQRSQRGHPPRNRHHQPAHRRDRDRAGRQGPRPLRPVRRGQVAGQGSRVRILDQRHRPGVRHRQSQLRRHRSTSPSAPWTSAAPARRLRSSSPRCSAFPVEDVNPQVGDTDAIGYTSMTGGSGAAFKTGWASYEAAQDVKRQMIDRAAMLWETRRRPDRARRRRLPGTSPTPSSA